MKTLIITAHPSSKGFTHKISEEYRKGLEAKGHEVEVINLYKTDLNQDFLRFEDVRNFSQDKSREIIQKKIVDSNELVFIHPMWWMSMPAIMKNFIDNNLTSGFAYKYEKDKIFPVGLLKGKTARVFITCDGPRLLYILLANPYKKIWKYGILMFCGVRVRSVTLFDKMRKRSDEHKNKWLASVYNIAKK